MPEGKIIPPQGDALRRRAENKMREKAAGMENLEAISPEETQQTLHELRVHQIELEIQNKELRLTQKELESTRTRYFDLYDMAPVGYVTLSKHGLILETNLTAATLLGVRRVDLVGQPLSRFIAKEEQDIYYLHRKLLFETGEPQAWALRMMKKDGMSIWVRMETTAAQDDDGTTLCRAAMSNITAEHKQVENALRELNVKIGEEALYHSLVDMASEGFWLLDKEFMTVYVNRALEDLLGYAKEELIGRSWYDFADPEWVARAKELEKHRVSGVKEAHPFLFIRKNGSKVLMRIATTPLYDDKGNFNGAFGILSDITGEKEAEDALRVKDWAIESAMNAIAMSDLEGKLTYVNPAFLKLWGYSTLDEVLGKSFMGSWQIGENAAEIIEILRTRRSWSGESVAKNKHGVPFDVLVSASMVENTAGESICMLAAFADITDRKQAEDAVKENEKKLRLAFGNAKDAIIWANSETGLIIDCNTAATELFEKPKGELVGSHQCTLHPPELVDYYQDMFADQTRDLRSGVEAQIVTSTGVIRTVTINVSNTEFEGSKIIQGIFRDISERKAAEEKLKDTFDRLRKAFNTIIQVMVTAVESRDPYTAGHQNRSAGLARAIAVEMGLFQDKIDGISMAGSIHDIGKLSIPAEILAKPTKLSEIEIPLIRQHAQKGYEMLKDVESPWPLAEMVYQHHERMDGSGYPRNLKGEEIIMEARILAVADVVESMASHRPYRPALGLNAALKEIENNKETLYDLDAVDACLRLFREKGYQLEGSRL